MVPLGVKGAALKACDEKVGFLLDMFEGVKDGDSTLKAFFDLLDEVVSCVLADTETRETAGGSTYISLAALFGVGLFELLLLAFVDPLFWS